MIDRSPRALALSVCSLAGLLALVVVVGFFARESAGWTAVEFAVVAATNGLHVGFLDVVARTIDIGLGPIGAAVVTAALVATVAVASRSLAAVIRSFALIAIPWALADVVKIIVQRPRLDSGALPHPMGMDPTTFSYPSGHTAFATALAMAAVLSVTVRARVVVGLLGAELVMVTAWSRMYLGAHYPLDVVASIVLVPAASVAVYDVCRRVRWLSGSRGVLEAVGR